MPLDSFDDIIDIVDIFYNTSKTPVVNKFTPPFVLEEVRDRLLQIVSGLDLMLRESDEMRIRPDISVFEYVKDVYPKDSELYNQDKYIYDVLGHYVSQALLRCQHLVDSRRTLAVSGAMRWRWSSEAPLGNLNDRDGDSIRYKTDTYKEGFCF